MKTITIAGGLTAPLAAMSLAALIAGAATAQTGPATPESARHARADTDGDGRISQAEFIQARTGPLATLDADRDGYVTTGERRAVRISMREHRQERRAERMARRAARPTPASPPAPASE